MLKNNIFVALGRVLLRFPKVSLLIILCSFFILASQLANLRVDTSAESFLREDAKPIVNYDKFRELFGRDEFFIIAITGVDVFSLDALQNLKNFHQTIDQTVPYLQSVESLVNVRSIYGEEDDLIAEELLETFPETQAQLAQIKQRVQNKPVYYGRLLNEQEDTLTILVKLQPFIGQEQADGSMKYHNLSDAEILRGYNELLAIAKDFEPHFGKDARIVVGGTPAIGSYMSTVLQRDFGVFTGVAIFMAIVVLLLLFKRAPGVFIPLAVMSIGVTSCIALMPVLDFPAQVTTSILPSFLLAVCVGASVHLLSIFFQHYDCGETKEEAILFALKHTATAILFTSLTTAAGLLSFSFSEILPVASLGLFAAIGSLLAFFSTVITVPILLYLTPIKRKAVVEETKSKSGALYQFTKGCLYLSETHPKKIVAVALLLMVASALIIPNIRFAQDSLSWFPNETPAKQAVQLIEEKITGTMAVELVIDTGEDQGVLDPEFLQTLDQWLEEVERKKFNDIPIRSVNALTTLIKETHQAFNGNEDKNYIIPDNQELIAQELLLIEMDQADDLYEFVEPNYRKTRLTLIVDWGDAIIFADFQDELRASFKQTFEGKYPLEITGVVPIFSKMFSAMISSAAQSYLIAALVISVMMVLLLKSVSDGILSMIPNLLPIMLVLSFMTIVDVPLDIFTVLIGSIALGLCVDDTVHFMHGFKAHLAKGDNAYQAVENTLFSTGKALVITTIVLFFAFLTYTLSGLKNMDTFGMLTAACIVLALLADFLVAPALMVLKYRNK